MITVDNVSLHFGASKLFANVNLVFTPGNCYGVIGANGAGKSTFLKILSGELEPTNGQVSMPDKIRMSVLKQNHDQYDQNIVMQTVLMGNPRLYEIMEQKEALYAKPDFSEEDGVLASELEEEFAELDGWEAESNAAKILQGLGIPASLQESKMVELEGRQKVKVLLAQALFGKPDVILLDEPTNNLDYKSIEWLEDFLLEFDGTVIMVSHDRHFLNSVCTHIVDIDYAKINLYVGNYDFWYESSRLMQQILRDQNRKAEEKAKELQDFIARFSANKSKAKQATSRKKLLDNLTVNELPASSRRYPWVSFKPDREAGKDILFVEDLTKTVDGVLVLDHVSFVAAKGDKIALVGNHEQANTTLMKILSGELEPDSGSFKWGVSTSQTYFPRDNTAFFAGHEESIIDWLAEYSEDPHESYLRQFLGRMLFSGEDVYKPVNVLSGGERVRCMLSRMMLSGANVLLLDQPTNHLDLESITALNNALTDFSGNLIFSSHDHQFIETIATRIIELAPTGVVDYTGTFDEYLSRQ
ncbi:ABC-F family ATP-binding cassette domain-containing protein [Scatolibacter rhodanostii]|uniref:ABC-F family ATP-binding cassette domain-containing protein n=1 Tax=Scatolibacter rhodanostii TaxID=2014781 RepID=UPI000C06F4CF|nr:ATP-binding cassette domain-containing protein [Scatolibacter rhodanostii]